MNVGRLAVEGETIELEWARPFAQEVAPTVNRAVLADIVVQSEPEALEREIGRERLGAGRKDDTASIELCVEVFEPRAPVRRQGDLDAGSRSPACSRHHEAVFHGTGRGGPTDGRSGELRAGDLVIAEGEASGRVDQPVAGSVAEPP